MSRSPMEVRMQYLGAARLLVETHNKYMNLYTQDVKNSDGINDEQIAMMDMFVSDFNQTSEIYIIQSTGNGRYGIFDRE